MFYINVLTVCIGGGIQAMGTIDSLHLGERIIIGGLFVQLIFFAFFIVVAGVFHYRLTKDLPFQKRYTPSSIFKARKHRQISSASSTAPLSAAPVSRASLSDLPWKRHLFNLYFTSALIMVRSIFRVVEYIGGNAGYLLSHEVFLFVFDATLMFFVMLSFNWVHPNQVTDAYQKRMRSATPMELQRTRDELLGREERMVQSRECKSGVRTGDWTPSRG
jgi:hypothetical protein